MCLFYYLKMPKLARWGCIWAGVVLFQNQLLTGVVLHFELGEVLFKFDSHGVVFKLGFYWLIPQGQPCTLNLSSFIFIICDNFSQFKCHFYLITKKSRFQALLIYSVLSWCPFYYSKMPKLARVGLYSSWGCIVSKSIFDWGCITFWMGWGSIQEWGCICADTVCTHRYLLHAYILLYPHFSVQFYPEAVDCLDRLLLRCNLSRLVCNCSWPNINWSPFEALKCEYFISLRYEFILTKW